jgi:hypothetical protein
VTNHMVFSVSLKNAMHIRCSPQSVINDEAGAGKGPQSSEVKWKPGKYGHFQRVHC